MARTTLDTGSNGIQLQLEYGSLVDAATGGSITPNTTSVKFSNLEAWIDANGYPFYDSSNKLTASGGWVSDDSWTNIDIPTTSGTRKLKELSPQSQPIKFGGTNGSSAVALTLTGINSAGTLSGSYSRTAPRRPYNVPNAPAVVIGAGTATAEALQLDDEADRYTATLTGNECADLTSAGNTLSAGTSKLAGHKAFDISTDLSLLGRNVDIYVKDGTVFGIPCYAVDEVYYTFTDASQLKEICAGGGFRLTEETAYYYNYTPSNKDILNTLSENDKITVIDHDGDNAFDVVLVTTSYPATVTSVSPLTVDVDGETQTVRAFSSTDVFTVGEAVYYSQICGNGYIRRLS